MSPRGRLRNNKYVRDLRTLPGDARVAWRHQGVRGVLREVRQRTVGRVFERGLARVVEQVLDDIPDVAPPDGVRIAPFEGQDWTTFETMASGSTIARFRSAVARGRTCLVAWRGDAPIGYTWISGRLEPDLETYPLPLPDDAAYGWDLYVVSSERGRGVGSALVSARLRHARAQGFRRMWRAIDVANAAAQRTLAATEIPGSMRITGTLTSYRLFRLRWSKFSPVGGERPEGAMTDA